MVKLMRRPIPKASRRSRWFRRMVHKTKSGWLPRKRSLISDHFYVNGYQVSAMWIAMWGGDARARARFVSEVLMDAYIPAVRDLLNDQSPLLIFRRDGSTSRSQSVTMPRWLDR